MIKHQSRVPVEQICFCPHCGGRLNEFTRLTYGNIELRNIDEVFFEGEPMPLTRNRYIVIDALVRSQGRLVSRSTLAMAFGGELFDTTVTANISRTRRAFRSRFPDFDQLQVARGFGAYRWVYREKEGQKPCSSASMTWPARKVEEPLVV